MPTKYEMQQRIKRLYNELEESRKLMSRAVMKIEDMQAKQDELQLIIDDIRANCFKRNRATNGQWNNVVS